MVRWWSLKYLYFIQETKVLFVYASLAVLYHYLYKLQKIKSFNFNVLSFHLRNLSMEEKFWNFVAVYQLIKRRKPYYQPYQGIRFVEIIYFVNA